MQIEGTVFKMINKKESVNYHEYQNELLLLELIQLFRRMIEVVDGINKELIWLNNKHD